MSNPFPHEVVEECMDEMTAEEQVIADNLHLMTHRLMFFVIQHLRRDIQRYNIEHNIEDHVAIDNVDFMRTLLLHSDLQSRYWSMGCSVGCLEGFRVETHEDVHEAIDYLQQAAATFLSQLFHQTDDVPRKNEQIVYFQFLLNLAAMSMLLNSPPHVDCEICRIAHARQMQHQQRNAPEEGEVKRELE